MTSPLQKNGFECKKWRHLWKTRFQFKKWRHRLRNQVLFQKWRHRLKYDFKVDAQWGKFWILTHKLFKPQSDVTKILPNKVTSPWKLNFEASNFAPQSDVTPLWWRPFWPYKNAEKRDFGIFDLNFRPLPVGLAGRAIPFWKIQTFLFQNWYWTAR